MGRPSSGNVRASLADQAGDSSLANLAIALGANLPSASGEPIDTLIAVRPLLEACLERWNRQWNCQKTAQGEAQGAAIRLRWSPLFETQPEGGPPGQPNYINAVLLVEGLDPLPQQNSAEDLLGHLQDLEQQFGRERQEHWGPRSLDLDLLWWGDLGCKTARLQLPHPHWQERIFVRAPLVALGWPCLDWPGLGGPAVGIGAPLALAGRPGWPE